MSFGSSNFVFCLACALALPKFESVEGFSTSSATMMVVPSNAAVRRNTGCNRIASICGSSSSSSLNMSSTQDEIAKLREAAAKAREDAARLSKELGKEDVDSTADVSSASAKTKPCKSPKEIGTSIRAIDFNSGSANVQVAALDKLRNDGSLSLYKSAVVDNGSGGLRSFPVSLSMLDNRSGLTAEKLGIGEEEVSLDDFKYGTLYVTGGCTLAGIAALALLPENIGATVCYLLALIPILWLGVGSTVPAAIANLILLVKGNDDDAVDKNTRVLRHEAAHFLCGYLCGLPVANYETTKEDIPRVEFHYSVDGSPATADRELTLDEINALTVVAMSGAVAEAMQFGKAKGGANSDLIELQTLFKKSEQFLGAQKQQDLCRWGALTAYRLLNTHKSQLDALVKAFSEQKSVADCVAIIEEL